MTGASLASPSGPISGIRAGFEAIFLLFLLFGIEIETRNKNGEQSSDLSDLILQKRSRFVSFLEAMHCCCFSFSLSSIDRKGENVSVYLYPRFQS